MKVPSFIASGDGASVIMHNGFIAKLDSLYVEDML